MTDGIQIFTNFINIYNILVFSDYNIFNIYMHLELLNDTFKYKTDDIGISLERIQTKIQNIHIILSVFSCIVC